jgi:hypothetical protein
MPLPPPRTPVGRKSAGNASGAKNACFGCLRGILTEHRAGAHAEWPRPVGMRARVAGWVPTTIPPANMPATTRPGWRPPSTQSCRQQPFCGAISSRPEGKSSTIWWRRLLNADRRHARIAVDEACISLAPAGSRACTLVRRCPGILGLRRTKFIDASARNAIAAGRERRAAARGNRPLSRCPRLPCSLELPSGHRQNAT